MSAMYLISIVLGIVGIGIIDWRYRLVFWCQPRRAVLTLLVAEGVFVIWDELCIWSGIFHQGHSRLQLAVQLLPQFPVEELLFLFLLCYVTLLGFRLLEVTC